MAQWHIETCDPEAELRRAYEAVGRVFRKAVANAASLRVDDAIQEEGDEDEGLLSILASGDAVDTSDSEGHSLRSGRQAQPVPPCPWAPELLLPYKPADHFPDIWKRLAELEERVQCLETAGDSTDRMHMQTIRLRVEELTDMIAAVKATNAHLIEATRTHAEWITGLQEATQSLARLSHHAQEDRVIGPLPIAPYPPLVMETHAESHRSKPASDCGCPT